MNTFILMWNPAISSYTWERFKDDQKVMCEDGWGEGVGNWSIWEHDLAHEGDRFFMVKVGAEPTGIVMAGEFLSAPYEDEDWSGKGRQTFYVDLDIYDQIDPDKAEIITTQELSRLIPDFDWSGGHSGRLLDKESADKLELLWLKYQNKMRGIKEEGAIYMQYMYELTSSQIEYFRRTRGGTCEVCGYDYRKVFGEDCDLYVRHGYLIEWDEQDDPQPEDKLMSRIRCVCRNCRQMDEEVLYKKLYIDQ